MAMPLSGKCCMYFPNESNVNFNKVVMNFDNCVYYCDRGGMIMCLIEECARVCVYNIDNKKLLMMKEEREGEMETLRCKMGVFDDEKNWAGQLQ